MARFLKSAQNGASHQKCNVMGQFEQLFLQ